MKNGGIQGVGITQAGIGYLVNPEVEAVEDLPPWHNYSNGFKEEGKEAGPGPGGEQQEDPVHPDANHEEDHHHVDSLPGVTKIQTHPEA